MYNILDIVRYIILTIAEIQRKRDIFHRGTNKLYLSEAIFASATTTTTIRLRESTTYVSFHARPAIFPFSKVDLVQRAAE